ncbi:hypothetical protein ABTY35_15165 [Streptomyces fimicarius]|uniref:hypothetical protein n=1 Tax=Streptomyces griseus TaxID=1911 RepID=UPI003332BCD5
MKRTVGKIIGVAAAAAGLAVSSTSPAAAFPYWQQVSTNSNWSCSDYQAHRLSFNIKFKTCVVRNANNDAQAVLVVQNSGTKAAVIRGEIATWVNGNSYRASISCYESTLNPGFTRGCFGPTESNTSRLRGETILWMNGYENINYSNGSWEN